MRAAEDEHLPLEVTETRVLPGVLAIAPFGLDDHAAVWAIHTDATPTGWLRRGRLCRWSVTETRWTVDLSMSSAGNANGGNGFTVVQTWAGRIVILAVAGELDLLTAAQFNDAIQAAFRKEPSAMIVDLTRVGFLASAGMNLLLAAYREITRSAEFGVVADGAATSRPLTLTGISSVITLYRTLGEALAAFADTPTPNPDDV